jgi:hypothetical protein
VPRRNDTQTRGRQSGTRGTPFEDEEARQEGRQQERRDHSSWCPERGRGALDRHAHGRDPACVQMERQARTDDGRAEARGPLVDDLQHPVGEGVLEGGVLPAADPRGELVGRVLHCAHETAAEDEGGLSAIEPKHKLCRGLEVEVRVWWSLLTEEGGHVLARGREGRVQGRR